MNKITIDEFISRSNIKHNFKYKYLKVNLINTKIKVEIICPRHDIFLQEPGKHLNGNGCPKCKHDKIKVSKIEFLNRVTLLHPNLSFVHSDYINTLTKVLVACPLHGDFYIKPSKLFVGQGCSKCSRRSSKDDILEKISPFNINNYDLSNVGNLSYFEPFTLMCLKHGEFSLVPNNIIGNKLMNCPRCSREKLSLTQEDFISRSKIINGDKFDYSLVDYVNLETKVIIKCNKGHIFKQRPDGHLKLKGCPKCGGHGPYSQDDFLFKAKQIHGDRYDFSKIEYINHKTPITVICSVHKDFFIMPPVFLRGSGCKRCAFDSFKLTQEEFLHKAVKVHLNRFDLSLIKYCGSNQYLTPICHKHGIFTIKAYKFLSGRGCPKCHISEGERVIENFLKQHKVGYIYQKRFSQCKRKQSLPFDFYLPEYNTCIEYDGIGHFRDIWGKKSYDSILDSDNIKSQFCKETGITLIRTSSLKNVNNLLTNLVYPISI